MGDIGTCALDGGGIKALLEPHFAQVTTRSLGVDKINPGRNLGWLGNVRRQDERKLMLWRDFVEMRDQPAKILAAAGIWLIPEPAVVSDVHNAEGLGELIHQEAPLSRKVMVLTTPSRQGQGAKPLEMEMLESLFRRVVDGEDILKPYHRKDGLDGRTRQDETTHTPPAGADRVEDTDQQTQPGTIEKGDIAQIEDDVTLLVARHGLEGLLERRSRHGIDAPIQPNFMHG